MMIKANRAGIAAHRARLAVPAVFGVLVIGWVSRVMWAIVELQVIDAEHGAGTDGVAVAEPSTPVGAAPISWRTDSALRLP